MSPYKGAGVTPEQQALNTAMSQIREPVKWLFKEVT